MLQTMKEFQENPPATKVELCGCGCGEPLEKNDPQGPQQMVVEGKTVFVNPDCYFDSIGKEIDRHPVGGPGIHGPKSGGSIDDSPAVENNSTGDHVSCSRGGCGGGSSG